jgi:hypothetical protein
MKIVGCDLHTRYQQIAMLEEETGELVERRLDMRAAKRGPSMQVRKGKSKAIGGPRVS